MQDIQNGCYDVCTNCFTGGNCCSSFDRINAPVLNKQELIQLREVLKSDDFYDDDNLYKGYKGRDLHWNDEALNSIASFRAELDTMMQKEFKCFLSHCLNQGTKILFVYAPSYYKVMQKLENVDEMYKMYESIATEFNIPILDYSYDLMCDDTTYFYNGTHLNKLGAEVFTTKLAHDIDSLGLLK